MIKPIAQAQHSKAPSMRFSEFSEQWKENIFYDLLSDILDFRGRTPLKLGLDWGGTIPSLSALNVKMGYIDLTVDPHLGSVELYKKWMNKGDLLKDDLLFTMEAPLGNVALVPDDKKYILSQRVVAFKTNKSVYNPFLYHLMADGKFQNLIRNLSTGTTAKGINQKSLSKVKVYVPIYSEQKKIADFLSSIDSWLNNLRSQKESLESYKKGMMQKIFSQEIRFKDEKGKHYPKWDMKKLEDLGEIIGGGTPATAKQEYWNGGINWFTPSEIKEKYAFSSIRKISKLGLNNSSTKMLPIGSLLFTSRATVGEVSISMEMSTTNQGFQSISVNNQNSNEFLYYWIKFNKNRFLRKANGSTFLEISNREMKSMKDKFPILPEQQKIADFLTSIDELIESKQKQIKETSNWKKGLMQQMFV